MVSVCLFHCFVLLLPGASETSNPSITPSTNVAVGNGTSGGSAGGSSPGAKDQLMYLAHLLGFTVQFSDFPKVYYNKLYECMSRGLSSLRMSILPPSPLWMCKSRLWDCRDGQHPTYPAWWLWRIPHCIRWGWGGGVLPAVNVYLLMLIV